MTTWSLVLWLTAGAIVGAVVGPFFTAKFKSETRVKISLGILVTLLGIWLLINTWLI
jgi:uncharacterized membrane protein YfcA